MPALQEIKWMLESRVPGSVVDAIASPYDADECLYIRRESIKAACGVLKQAPELAFDMLIELTCLDMIAHPDWDPERPERFEVVYILYSTVYNRYVKLKVKVTEDRCEVDSVSSIWKAADWTERELHEMYGVKFTGHPNLKPLFLWEGFKGFPLRKDYPLKGQQPIAQLRRPIPLSEEPGHSTPQFEKDFFAPQTIREITETQHLPTSMLRPTWRQELIARKKKRGVPH